MTKNQYDNLSNQEKDNGTIYFVKGENCEAITIITGDIAQIQTDMTTINNSIITINDGLVTIENNITTLSNKIATLENKPPIIVDEIDEATAEQASLNDPTRYFSFPEE